MSTEPQNQSENPNKGPNKKLFWIIGAKIILIPVAIAVYFVFFWQPKTSAPPPIISPSIEESRESTEETLFIEPDTTEVIEKPNPPLPPLNESDGEVISALTDLTTSTQWLNWITTDEAVRKFVVVIDNIAQGKIARKYIPIPKPKATFKSTPGVKHYLDQTSHERFTPYVNLFDSLDNRLITDLYRRYSPLLEQAYSELGYPNSNFHNTLLQAFDTLLEAPVIEEDIELVRPSVFYKFADENLENLSEVHKQLIRMGPDNTRKLQQKVRSLQASLLKP